MSENMSRRPSQEVFGVPARSLVNVVESANSVALLGRKSLLPSGVYRDTLETAVNVWPLVEDVRKGKRVTPQDVRPHADEILDNIVTNFAVRDAIASRGDSSTARKLGWLSRVSDMGFVRDRAIPEVEKRFPEKVKGVLDSPDTKWRVRHGLEVAKPYAEVVAAYDDPQGQYIRELDVIAKEIRHHTREARDARLSVEYARYPVGSFRAWLLRRRHGKKSPDELIKPIDAAHGIDRVVRRTLEEDAETTRIPMLRTIIETALRESQSRRRETAPLPRMATEALRPRTRGMELPKPMRTGSEKSTPVTMRTLAEKIPRLLVLEAVAPEIIRILEAPLAKNQRDPRFLKSLQKGFSFKAKIGRFFKVIKLNDLRQRGPRLLRDVRDVLPRSGRDVTRAMGEIREFFLT